MLPIQRMIVSKSVCLIIIFLSSTSFGFLENEYRDVMSRRDVRGSRDPVNKNTLIKLPFRKDYEHRANEKDRVYENLYDRRSFRTGTNRLTKIEDRFLNERSAELKNHFSDNRERYFQERSRTLQNDKIRERSSSTIPIKQMRKNQLENEQQSVLQRPQQNWEYNERSQFRDNKARQIHEQKLTDNRIQDLGQQRERSPENNERLHNKAREIRQRGNHIAREIREQRLTDNRIQDIRRRESSLENNENVRDNRAREIGEHRLTDNINYNIRQRRKRSLENDKHLQFREDRAREIREQRLTYNRFQGIRQRRERSLENNERSQFRGNRARETDEQSLRGHEIQNIRQRRDRDFENNERLQMLDNRAREIRERGLQNNERLEFRDSAREVREHRLTNRIQDIRQTRERSLDNNERSQFRDNRAREIHERSEQSFRDHISQDIRQRSLDNIQRSQFRNRVSEIREERLTDKKIHDIRHQRERNLENNNERSHFRENRDREIRERRLTDNRIQEIRHRRERSLGTEERFRDNAARQTRGQRDIRQQRERSLEDQETLQSRENREQLRGNNMIRDIKHERSFRDLRLNPERRTANRDSSLDEQEIRQSGERNMEIRARFSEERTLRQNRIRDNKQSREHKLENREKEAVSQGFRDNRFREINKFNDGRVENKFRDLGDRYRGQRNRDVRVYRKQSLDRRTPIERNIHDIKEERQSRVNPEISSLTIADREENTFSDISTRESRFSNKNRVMNSRISDRRASLSRSDSASRTQNAQINLQEQARNKQCTRKDIGADRNLIERQVVPIAEFTGNTRRFFRNIDEINQKKINLNAFVHIVQVILGVYLIGQIFARSSKKTAFGFHRLLPSVNSIKQKIE